jgi:hypothetical protein
MKTSARIITTVILAAVFSIAGISQVSTTTGVAVKAKSAKGAAKSNSGEAAIEVAGYPVAATETVRVQGLPLSKETVNVQKSRQFGFNEESTKTESKVTVGNEYNYLGLAINAELLKGTFLVEILDPKGVKQGSFSLVTEESTVKGSNTTFLERVMGNIMKEFRNPMKGDWIVRITPEKATGSVSISISQRFVENIDVIELNSFEKR